MSTDRAANFSTVKVFCITIPILVLYEFTAIIKAEGSERIRVFIFCSKYFLGCTNFVSRLFLPSTDLWRRLL